tara:strand:- start:154 stop:399 length:246 start_codon:yes stop_codon:yes gene_type:complete
MSAELTDRLVAEYHGKYLTLSEQDLRDVVKNVVEKTKKHIAKNLVDQRKDDIEALAREGFIDNDYSSEEIEELILEALNKL